MLSITNNNGRGRTVKFTPERIDQIINLVERGISREEIAEIIGCSLGSLQVTCSRLGVSLRRIRHRDNDVMSKAPSKDAPPPSGDSPTNGQAVHIKAPPAPAKPQAEISLVLRSSGRERTYSIPLSPEVLIKLSMEACVNDKTMAEWITELLKK
jgi:hypothetical protein